MKDRPPAPERPLAEGIPLDDFVPYLLNRISNRLNSDLAAELRGLGHSLPQWRVLAVLRVRDGRALSELSVYTVIEQSTLSRIVERMVKAGLVERRAHERDARVVRVHLTAGGRAAFERMVPVALCHYRRATAGIGPGEVERLVATLHRILDNVRSSRYP